MLHFDGHRKTSTEGEINALTAWLTPSSLLIGSLLSVAFVVAISGSSWCGDVTDTVTSQPAPLGLILGASMSHPPAASVASPTSPTGPYAFAFGYLEFDWDLNAPGGMPGFQGWTN